VDPGLLIFKVIPAPADPGAGTGDEVAWEIVRKTELPAGLARGGEPAGAAHPTVAVKGEGLVGELHLVRSGSFLVMVYWLALDAASDEWRAALAAVPASIAP
jgi:hypothetical protein